MRHASLCMGIGGLDLAVESVYGSELAWFSEIEPAACAVIERNWSAPNIGDLTTFDWADAEPVDILTAGYPCQPFSHAGKRKGKNDARHLWPFIAEGVRVLRPSRVVLENVRGHLSLGFDEVLGSLAEAGFDAEWCLLRASDVGAPHKRARLFVVAADTHGGGREQRDQGVGLFPEPRKDRSLAAPDPYGEGPQRRGRDDLAPREEQAPALHRGTVADADGEGLSGIERIPQGRHALHGDGGRDADRRDRDVHVAWGAYAAAIDRWERTLGRPAPTPTDDAGRLSPRFVEWMMGYPTGWVDGLSRTQALKALGNAVVPQQGIAAIGLLEAAHLTQEAAA